MELRHKDSASMWTTMKTRRLALANTLKPKRQPTNKLRPKCILIKTWKWGLAQTTNCGLIQRDRAAIVLKAAKRVLLVRLQPVIFDNPFSLSDNKSTLRELLPTASAFCTTHKALPKMWERRELYMNSQLYLAFNAASTLCTKGNNSSRVIIKIGQQNKLGLIKKCSEKWMDPLG